MRLGSLRSRTVLLVLASVIVAQTATVTLFTLYRRHMADIMSSDMVIPVIRMAKGAIDNLPPDERTRLFKAADPEQWQLFTVDQVQPPQFVARDKAPGMIRRINTRLDGEAEVSYAAGDNPAFWVRLNTPHGQWWLVLPSERVRPPIPVGSLLLLTGLLLVILTGAGVYAVHITRPLEKLAAATGAVAQGNYVSVDPQGPLEIRELAQRFNSMSEALDEANKTQRTLLAGLPHDLKGPLSRLRLRAAVAEDPELAKGMLKDTQDMQDIVEQFLAYLRGSEQASYSMQRMALQMFVRERVDHAIAAGQPVQLLHADNCEIRGDAFMLVRLLDNLVNNALEHGAPPVQVQLLLREEFVELMVRDHGQGIPPDRRAEALEPFARLDSARTATGNVGLGLAIAERVAHLHGGELILDAAPGGGLLVIVRLPTIKDAAIKQGDQSSDAG
jgi:two-component system osmolarity sensor histidine kinase EnvZ